jgi:N6-adenosine-specific RNA methylase IME4
MKVKIDDIIIGERFRKELGDIQTLADSIKEIGLLHPIVVRPDLRLIAGRRRIEAYRLLGMTEIEATVIDLDNLVKGEFAENEIRKDFTWSERVEIAKMLEPEERVAARDRQGSLNHPALIASEKFTEAGSTLDKVAQVVGTSRPTLVKAGEIYDSGEEDLIQEMDRTGKVHGIHGRLKQRQRADEIKANPIPPPEGKYRCIVCDPPWPMQKIDREERPAQGAALDYPTMSIDDIFALPIPASADETGCHLYLWVTHKYLPTGLRIMEAWGFRYQCLMTWVKPTGMTPYSWMYNTEHVLFGRCGNLQLDRLGIKLSFEAAIVRHSQKPDIFYDIVREASPGPRLEYFARQERDGFDVWGDEVINGNI